MRRSYSSPLLALAVLCFAAFGPASSAAPEKLGAPKEIVAQGKKDAEPAAKDGKDEPKKDEAKKEETKSEEPKKEEAKPHEVPILQTKKMARDSAKAAGDEIKKSDPIVKDIPDAKVRGDTAWMLTASAFVMLMVPGLALFYGGMVRKKNVLATMMQSYAALAVVGLFWIAVGYGLAFGPSQIPLTMFGKTGGFVGWSSDLFFLRNITADQLLPTYNITVYTHVMFQGMFAIITPALISGALAERIRFWPFCIYMILWVTCVYCPLAHMVWAFDWFYAVPVDAVKGVGGSPIGLLGVMGALDFAGGTVVHIAAGTAGLACALVLRKRVGYPEHTIQPNSMVLTLIGAGLLWFGWFGFNGGSALNSTSLAGSAFSATQAAAASAGLSWIIVEWLMKGKPTALGLASGIVAGLVAVTPASGFVLIWGGVFIGLIAGVVCYFSVAAKSLLGYDDSLDAFGVHAVGGFLGAILTGIFCYAAVQSASADGYFAIKGQNARLAELRAEFTDGPALFDIDDADKKLTTAKADKDKVDTDIENAQADLSAIIADDKAAVEFKKKAEADLKAAEADLEKAKAGKKEEEIKKAEEALTSAKDVPDKATALIDLFKKQKDAQEDVTKAEVELKKLQDGIKKSKATVRSEELTALVAEDKDKDKEVKAAKKELDDATEAYTSKADAARKAADKGKGSEVKTAKDAFDAAAKTKKEKDDKYQDLAAKFKELQNELKKLADKKVELRKLEDNASKLWSDEKNPLSQFWIQLKAATISAVFAFSASLLLAIIVQVLTMGNFTTDKKSENEGLDLTEHGEIGFDFATGYDSIAVHGAAEPKAAKVPPGQKRFDVVVEGIDNGGLIKAWAEMCQPTEGPVDPDFKAVYPYVTTIQGSRFRLRGGDPATLSASIQKLFSKKLGKPLKVRVEE